MNLLEPSRFDAPVAASATLPPDCMEGLARLTRLIKARAGKFEWLSLDCRDQLLRDRLIAELDERLAATQGPAAFLRLNELNPLDFAEVERALVAMTANHRIIHITGGPAWFNAERWESFNIRREAVAHQAKASLLFWLDEGSIADLARIAIDLWAWRGAVITFSATPRPLALALPTPEFREIDNRPGSERIKRIEFLRQVLRERALPEDIGFGLALELGDLMRSIGEIEEAEAAYREAATAALDESSRAIVQGRIADILTLRGEFDEALRIRREEELPVYTRLGAARSIAITQSRIADILTLRGELEEALRIRREDELPVYKRLGDLRSAAVTLGGIADILALRGEFDEALRIRRDEVLPVYTRLGDLRSIAFSQGRIAGILRSRGELDAARALQMESLKTSRRLQDADGIADSLWSLALLDMEQNADEAALCKLREAWPLLLELGRADGLARVGSLYGRLLIFSGQQAEAIEVLRTSAAAYRKLGNEYQAREVEEILASIDRST